MTCKTFPAVCAARVLCQQAMFPGGSLAVDGGYSPFLWVEGGNILRFEKIQGTQRLGAVYTVDWDT